MARIVLAISLVLVAGCGQVGSMTESVRDRFDGEDAPEGPATEATAPTAEVPEVSGPASWDGLPSLGGVWVAHPDVSEPARVRLARAAGGSPIEGWLFGRESRGEEPPLQVSSEAAAALGLAAGETAELIVEPLDGAPPPPDG